MASVSPHRFVPFGFARSHRVLVMELTNDVLEIWVDETTKPAAVAELARSLPYKIHPVVKTSAELQEAMTRAYAQQDGSAASAVDAAESDIDLSRLMQDVPKVEDLLETEDDAPIIRMINAL